MRIFLRTNVVIFLLLLLRILYIRSVNVVRTFLRSFFILFSILFRFFDNFLYRSLTHHHALLLLFLNFLSDDLFLTSSLRLVGVRRQRQVTSLACKHLFARLLYTTLGNVLLLRDLSAMYDLWLIVVVAATLFLHFVEGEQVLLAPLKVIELLSKLRFKFN